MSNAPEGYPKVSPTGYELTYPIDGNGKVVGKPTLRFDNQDFADEAEIEHYKKRLARRIQVGQTGVDRKGDGQFPAGWVTPEKSPGLAEYLWFRRIPYHFHTGGRDIHFDFLSGSMLEVNNAKQIGSILNPGSQEVPPPSEPIEAAIDALEQKYTSAVV